MSDPRKKEQQRQQPDDEGDDEGLPAASTLALDRAESGGYGPRGFMRGTQPRTSSASASLAGDDHAAGAGGPWADDRERQNRTQEFLVCASCVKTSCMHAMWPERLGLEKWKARAGVGNSILVSPLIHVQMKLGAALQLYGSPVPRTEAVLAALAAHLNVDG